MEAGKGKSHDFGLSQALACPVVQNALWERKNRAGEGWASPQPLLALFEKWPVSNSPTRFARPASARPGFWFHPTQAVWWRVWQCCRPLLPPPEPLTAVISEARLGSVLSPCTDPPNPKTHSHWRMPRTRLPGQARLLQFQPTQLRSTPRAQSADPMGAAGWKKRNWTPHCSCWWSGRNTSPARPVLPSLCPRGRRWSAEPALALPRRQLGRVCRFGPD